METGEALWPRWGRWYRLERAGLINKKRRDGSWGSAGGGGKRFAEKPKHSLDLSGGPRSGSPRN